VRGGSPLSKSEHSAVPKQDAGAAVGGRLRGIRLLIADDDVRNIYSMTTLLEQEGAEVVCAMDGNEALAILLAGSRPDAILIDLMMPVKDGMTAIREIRQVEQLRNLPVIAVTGRAMDGDRELCIAAGANEYMVKPVDLEKLISLLQRILSTHNEKVNIISK
jgi:CheY-like chemotaxis protein